MTDTCIVFCGNPNCGKTTLFNAYTGANLKTANWPGVTVDSFEGEIKRGEKKYKLADLPGTYSLSSYTIEERVSHRYILSEEAGVIINVADATNLGRSLYLTLQLTELKKPTVLALNMTDILKKRHITLNTERLSEILGIPVCTVSAKKREGLDRLIDTAIMLKEKGNSDLVSATALPEAEEAESIRKRYDFIEKILDEVLIDSGKNDTKTEKADKLLTHEILGLPIFLLIMSAVFLLTFTLGDFIKGFFEGWLESFTYAAKNLLLSVGTAEWAVSLVTDGIIAGVGGILTFLPNIFILFLLLAVLEDSGYMSRAAYVTDGFMGKLGLSGRAFIPMLLGFGCSVPAVMATRTLERRGDRLKTIFMIPFMSCSAKLPVYVMLSEMFFGKYAPIAAYSMYIAGFFIGNLALFVFSKINGGEKENPLLIELPDYKIPDKRTVWIYVKEKIKDYLTKAGTTIFAASTVLWFLLDFGKGGFCGDISESYAAVVGKLLVPLMNPTGLGSWQIIVSLISGIAAKEVVVSSMSVIYGIGNISSAEGMSMLAEILKSTGFTALNAYSMMLFTLLYIPCIAAVATIKRESASWQYTALAMILQLALAWLVSVIFYQVGGMFF